MSDHRSCLLHSPSHLRSSPVNHRRQASTLCVASFPGKRSTFTPAIDSRVASTSRVRHRRGSASSGIPFLRSNLIRFDRAASAILLKKHRKNGLNERHVREAAQKMRNVTSFGPDRSIQRSFYPLCPSILCSFTLDLIDIRIRNEAGRGFEECHGVSDGN